MAQVTISDEHYQTLVELARQRGTTPDALLDLVMDEMLDQLDDQAWDELLSRPEAGAALDRLAQEARAARDRGDIEEWP